MKLPILIFIFLCAYFLRPTDATACMSSPCTVLASDGPEALEDAFVNIGDNGIILLPDCNYTINSTTVFNSNNGTFFGFPMSYLAINDRNVTVLGNSDGVCPGNVSKIWYLQDNVPDPSFVQYIPFGLRVMNNDTRIFNIGWAGFYIDLYPYPVPYWYLYESLNGSDYSYIVFISETLCPFGPNGDCTLDSYTIGSSFDAWFPTYDINDVTEYSHIINGFEMYYCDLATNFKMRYPLIAMGPITMCNYTVSYNFFHNSYTLFPFQYDAGNPNTVVCPGYDSPPYDNGRPLMDFRLNCFDHTEDHWCTNYLYYTCFENWYNTWLDMSDPNTPPDPIWLPYADCDCDYRPSPLFSYWSEDVHELVGFLTLDDYLNDPNTYDGTLHLGGEPLVLNETVVVYQKSFNLVGNVDPSSCECPVEVHVLSNVNPGFLVIENLMCVDNVVFRMDNENTTAIILRGADALHVGQKAVYTDLIGTTPSTAITQAYVPGDMTSCTFLVRESEFVANNASNIGSHAIISLEGDQVDSTFNIVAFNSFRNMDIGVYSAYGSLDIHDNLFTNLNRTTVVNTTGIVLGHEAVRSRVVDNVFSGNHDGIKMMGGHENNVTCNIFVNDTQSDVLFPCGSSSVEDSESGLCPDFICHYTAAASEYFQLYGSKTASRNRFLLDLSYPGITYEETSYQEYIILYMLAVYDGVVPTCSENIYFLLYELMHDSVQLNTCIFSVLYGDPGSCTITLDDIEFIFSTIIDLYDAEACCPPTDPCTTGGAKKTIKSQHEAMKHVHGASSRLLDLPNCFSSVENVVQDNYHYGDPWVSGDAILYDDPDVAVQNTLDSTYGFGFSGADVLTDIMNYVEFPPNLALSYSYTFGFDPLLNSATVEIESVEHDIVDDDAPLRFFHGTYVEDWHEPCRPDDAQPYLLSVFDDFTRLTSDSTEVDGCTSCVVRFQINSTEFDTFYADNDIELTCADVSIITLTEPYNDIWVQLDTVLDCDDSDEFYTFEANCTGSTAHYAVGPPPRIFYVECEGGTPFPNGIPVYDLETALTIMGPHSTVYLSDGHCCADEIILINKTGATIQAYWDDCWPTVSCCEDPDEISVYGNGICDFVIAIAYGSSGFTIRHINWVNVNSNDTAASAVYVNPHPYFLGHYMAYAPPYEILTNVTIEECTFVNSTIGVSTGVCANCSVDGNQFGGSVVAPCIPLTVSGLPVTYEWASEHRVNQRLPHAERLRSNFKNQHQESMYVITEAVFSQYQSNLDSLLDVYHEKSEALRRTTQHKTETETETKTVASIVQTAPVAKTSNAIIDRIHAARQKNAVKKSASVSAKAAAPQLMQSHYNKLGRLVSSPFSEYPCTEIGIRIDPTLPAEFCAGNNQNNYGLVGDAFNFTITNNVFNSVYKAIHIAPFFVDQHEPATTPIEYVIQMNQINNATGVGIQIEQSESEDSDDKFIVSLNNIIYCGHNAFGLDLSGGHMTVDSNTLIECPSTVFGSDIMMRLNAFITSTVTYTDSSPYSRFTKAVDQGGNTIRESLFLNSSLVHWTQNGVAASPNTRHNSGIRKTSGRQSKMALVESVTSNSPGRDCTSVLDNLFAPLLDGDDVKTIVSQWTRCSAIFHYICTEGNVDGNLDPVFVEYPDSCVWDLDGKAYCLDNTIGAYLYRSKTFPQQCGICNCGDNLPYKVNNADFYPGGVCPPVDQIYSDLLTEYGTGVNAFLTCGTQNETSDLVPCPIGLKRGADGKCSVKCDVQDDNDSSSGSGSSDDDDDDDHGSNLWWIIGVILAFLTIVLAVAYICSKWNAEERYRLKLMHDTYNNVLMSGGATNLPNFLI